jgi:hypothetical protein
MTWHVGVGGAWKEVTRPYVGVGGVWKSVEKMWVGVGGVWKEFYTALSASLTGRTVSHIVTSPTNAAAGVRVTTDGFMYTLRGTSYVQIEQWLLGGTVAEMECRWTNTSGTLSSGTAGSWLPCSSNQEFSVAYTPNTPGSTACTGTLEIRMAASPNTVLASASYSLYAEVA